MMAPPSAPRNPCSFLCPRKYPAAPPARELPTPRPVLGSSVWTDECLLSLHDEGPSASDTNTEGGCGLGDGEYAGCSAGWPLCLSSALRPCSCAEAPTSTPNSPGLCRLGRVILQVQRVQGSPVVLPACNFSPARRSGILRARGGSSTARDKCSLDPVVARYCHIAVGRNMAVVDVDSFGLLVGSNRPRLELGSGKKYMDCRDRP